MIEFVCDRIMKRIHYLMVRFLIEILSSVERTIKRFEGTGYAPRIFLKPVDLSLQQMMQPVVLEVLQSVVEDPHCYCKASRVFSNISVSEFTKKKQIPSV